MPTSALIFSAALVLSLNLASYLLFWWDKHSAARGGWRIRESTLLLIAFIGGSVGAVAAQRTLRHKTRKEPFRTYLALIAALHVFMGVILLGLWIVRPDIIEGLRRAVGLNGLFHQNL